MMSVERYKKEDIVYRDDAREYRISFAFDASKAFLSFVFFFLFFSFLRIRKV